MSFMAECFTAQWIVHTDVFGVFSDDSVGFESSKQLKTK